MPSSPLSELKPLDAASDPLSIYEEGVTCGKYRADDRQAAAVQLLDDLHHQLAGDVDKTKNTNLSLASAVDEGSSSGLGGLGGLWATLTGKASSEGDAPPPRGLYLYGGVGAGKTMLMDMFAGCVPGNTAVRRAHFHDFMLDVHARLRRHEGAPDPLRIVSKELVTQEKGDKEHLVLCLDEFMVTDVADAMILNRLFTRLFARGLVLVATSNRAPDRLYENGLQRDLFLPFIALLKQRTRPHDILSSTDYRRLAQQLLESHHYTGPHAMQELRESFTTLAGGAALEAREVEVMMGRSIRVEQAAGPLAFMPFAELCEQPVAAADYIALCGAFHTLALGPVPVFDASNRPAAYRFVTLVDVMYEHRTRLLCAAEADPFHLFEFVVTQENRPAGAAVERYIVDDNLGFAKDRIVSRLTEMQSVEYARAHAQLHAPELLDALPQGQ